MGWVERSLSRKDDPYHSWAYERDEDQGLGHEGYCPAIVQIKADGSDPTALLENLNWLLTHVEMAENKPFLMPFSDVADLKSLIALHSSSDQLSRLDAYDQLFLLYIEEGKTCSPSEIAPQFDANLRLIYVGAPSAVEGITVLDPSIEHPGTGGARAAKKACLAIIDDSIAFLNDAFVNEDKSLFDYIWFQKNLDLSAPTGEVASGVQLLGSTIDALRAQQGDQRDVALYESEISAVGDVPFRAIDRSSKAHQPLAFSVSHGTHVTDTALKSYLEHEGALDDLALCAVTLPVEVTQNTSGSTLGSPLLAALRHVMLWADEVATGLETPPPLILNFSYGFTAGPKDGSDPLNKAMQMMVDSRNAAGKPTVLVVPMGNSYQDRGNAEVTLGQGESKDVTWALLPNDRTSSFLEVISLADTGSGDFTMTLWQPGSEAGEAVPIDGSLISGPDGLRSKVLCDGDDDLIGMCCEWPAGATSQYKRRAFLAMGPTAGAQGGLVQSGAWRIRLTNTSENPVTFQVSVQSDDAPGTYPALGRQSYLDAVDSRPPPEALALKDELFPPHATLTHRRTASVFASNQSPYVLAIGAGRGEAGPTETTPTEPSRYTSAGPRHAKARGPSATALADRSSAFLGIYRAGTHSGTLQALSGSSVAAPQIAGELAARPYEVGRYESSDQRDIPQNLRSLRFKA